MYNVLLEKSAERDLKKLHKGDFERLIRQINMLAENPHPPNCRKIVGSENDRRIRIGDFRIIYEVVAREKTVRIMRIRRRGEAYRRN